jgi:long-chain acyl-CoA synthetase
VRPAREIVVIRRNGMEKNYKCWPAGVFKHLTYHEVPVFEGLRSSARQWPWRNAIIFGGMELTYAELDNLSDRFAAALADMGVRKGDRVAVHLPNCPQTAIAFYGLLKAGAVYVPVSPLLTEREFTFQLSDSGAETYIGLDLLFDMPKQALPATPVKNVIVVSLADCFPPLAAPAKLLQRQPTPEGTTGFTSLLAAYHPEPPEIDLDVKEDLAFIAYTGGTTGTPKGVMIAHFAAMVSCVQYCCWTIGGEMIYEDGKFGVRRMEGDSDDDHPLRIAGETLLLVAPWFHIMGIFQLYGVIAFGQTLVTVPRFDPTEFLQAIPKYRVTAFAGAPQLFFVLEESPLFPDTDMSGIRLINSAAAPISQNLLETLLEKASGVISEVYGMTEALVCTCSPCTREEYRLGSVGMPLADTEMKIVDAETGETELPAGEVGEICVKGPQVMKGYWNRPEETAQAIRDGWLHTGDMGRFDEDGFLFIVDRKKDMLIYKGYNVYLRDLEEVLSEHPAVSQCAVVGKYDERYGDIPVAFVQLVPGASASEEELLEYANSRLAAYKKIRALRIVEALPVNLVGKVLKRELREAVQALDVEHAPK